MDYRIEEILTEIENNLSQPPKIKNLSASKGLSVSRFQHLFKQEVEMSFVNYVRERRLQKTRELLETTHLRIQEICVKVGASNETHFLRDFKQKFGLTPTQYRKNFRRQQNLPINSRIR